MNWRAMISLLVLCATGISAQSFPGTCYWMDGKDKRLVRYYIPDIPVLRGLVINDQALVDTTQGIGREASLHAAIMGFGVLDYAPDPGRFSSGMSPLPLSDVKQYLSQVATQSGHPELPNLPVITAGQLNMDSFQSVWGSLLIACSAEGVGSFLTDGTVPSIKCVEEGSYGGPAVVGSGGKQHCWAIQWGWGHGFMSQRDIDWPWHYQIAMMRIPQNWNPLSGPPTLKSCTESDAWYGDPNIKSTNENQLPYIAPSASYSRGKAGAEWLPNRYMAWVWRAYHSRHPTEKMHDQGLDHVSGTGGNNGSLSGMPGIVITSPSRPFHPTRVGGKDYPLFKQGDAISIKAEPDSVNFEKIEIYDGDRKIAEMAPNAYRVYIAQKCTLTTPGPRSLIALLHLKNPTSVITSRPSTVWVGDSIVSAWKDQVDAHDALRHGHAAARNDALPEMIISFERDVRRRSALSGEALYDMSGRKIPGDELLDKSTKPRVHRRTESDRR